MWSPRPEGVAEVMGMLRQGVDSRASTETLNRVRVQLDTLSASNAVSDRWIRSPSQSVN